MSATASGFVSYVTQHTTYELDGTPGKTLVRVVIRQAAPRAPQIEAWLLAGHGNAGLAAADLMRQRLRPGTPCVGTGDWIGPGPDERRLLVLHGAHAVHGGEHAPHHEPQETAA